VIDSVDLRTVTYRYLLYLTLVRRRRAYIRSRCTRTTVANNRSNHWGPADSQPLDPSPSAPPTSPCHLKIEPHLVQHPPRSRETSSPTCKSRALLSSAQWVVLIAPISWQRLLTFPCSFAESRHISHNCDRNIRFLFCYSSPPATLLYPTPSSRPQSKSINSNRRRPASQQSRDSQKLHDKRVPLAAISGPNNTKHTESSTFICAIDRQAQLGSQGNKLHRLEQQRKACQISSKVDGRTPGSCIRNCKIPSRAHGCLSKFITKKTLRQQLGKRAIGSDSIPTTQATFRRLLLQTTAFYK
jgi:hypothetical protein